MVFDGGTRLRLAVPLGTSVFKTERVVQGFGDGGDEFVAGYTNALEKKFLDLQKLDEEFEIVDFPLLVPCHAKKVHIMLEAFLVTLFDDRSISVSHYFKSISTP